MYVDIATLDAILMWANEQVLLVYLGYGYLYMGNSTGGLSSIIDNGTLHATGSLDATFIDAMYMFKDTLGYEFGIIVYGAYGTLPVVANGINLEYPAVPPVVFPHVATLIIS